MFFKSYLGMLFVAALISGSFFLIKMDKGDNDISKISSINRNAIVSNQVINKKNNLSLKNKKAKIKKPNRILSPDELYEQQFTTSQTEFELEPTIPEIEALPEELEIIEKNASILSENLDEDALSGNLVQMDGKLQKDDWPPSEDYKEVIPFELEQIEFEQN